MLAGSVAAPRAGLPIARRCCSSAFKGVSLRAPLRVARMQRADVRVRASFDYGVQEEEKEEVEYIPEWPNPKFVEEVLAAFPEKMIANVEEARTLWEHGWVYLDVRPQLEVEEAGCFRQSCNIPIYDAQRTYDPEKQRKVLTRQPNPDFIPWVQQTFPDLETPFIVGCSDGVTYALDALEALDEAGYTYLVGLKGGYNAWARTFDNNLRRRRGDGFVEAYTHDGDSCGIHGTGAGFARMDAVDKWGAAKFVYEGEDEEEQQ